MPVPAGANEGVDPAGKVFGLRRGHADKAQCDKNGREYLLHNIW